MIAVMCFLLYLLLDHQRQRNIDWRWHDPAFCGFALDLLCELQMLSCLS